MIVEIFRTPDTVIGPPLAKPPARGTTLRHVDARMNKGETAYSRVLETRKHVGELLGWWFEMVTIRVADNTHYRTDFLVQLADGTLELHEVKGRKGDAFFVEEDAWVKLKIVAELVPFTVVVVWPNKAGVWQRRVV
jgi:hypothetical protein